MNSWKFENSFGVRSKEQFSEPLTQIHKVEIKFRNWHSTKKDLTAYTATGLAR